MSTPIRQCPTTWLCDGVGVQFRRPSCAKIRSRLHTSAGVRMVHFGWGGSGFLSCVLVELLMSRSESESESRRAEKTMFARCLFRLVI